MLKSLKITNYRGFEHYNLEPFRSVNLLVGKNNSGKTALLEAVHFLASGGNPTVLVSAALRRGEVIVGRPEEEHYLDISHFFSGHQVRSGTQLVLQGEGDRRRHVTIKAVSLDEIESPGLFASARPPGPAMAMHIDSAELHEKPKTFFLSSRGAFAVEEGRPLRRYHSFGEESDIEAIPIQFIAPDSIEPRSLSEMWNQVLLEGKEPDVIKAMQLLEPDIASIAFLTGESMYRFHNKRAGILASFGKDQRRLPLGSYGDGMRRLLALSISLIRSKGGYLVIDEIDTGFHYSIMGDMWRLVVQTAIDSGIQVFATTHSLDCLRGLATLIEYEPGLQNSVSVHKVEPDLEASVAFIGKDIVTAVKQGIEVR